MILVNPSQGANTDIPNVPLGFVARHFGCRVVDLNTLHRSDLEVSAELSLADNVLMSVQSRGLSAAESIRRMTLGRVAATIGHPAISSRVRSVTTMIRSQCVYAFLSPWGDANNVHVDPLPRLPNYTQFDSFGIFQSHWKDGSWPYALYSSFNCPYLCSFCAARKGTWTPRNMEDFCTELNMAIQDYGAKSFTLMDDVANLKESHIIRVSEAFKFWGRQWMCANGLRADRLTEKGARAMADSGCHAVGFGIETSNDLLLKQVQKGETWTDIQRGLEIAKGSFGSVSGFLILGLPGSSYDIDRRTVDDCLDAGIYLHVSTYVPGADTAGLAADVTFYGEHRAHSSAYSEVDQERLLAATRGLAWGCERSWQANLSGRLRLLLAGKWQACGRLCRMDAHKVWRRIRR